MGGGVWLGGGVVEANWRIQGREPGTRPLGVQILFFYAVFGRKFAR